MNIKTRITLWYISFFIIVIVTVLAILFSVGSYQAKTSVTNRLVSVIDDALSEVEYDDDEYDIDIDSYFVHGVYVSVYNGDGKKLAGSLPEELTEEIAFYNSNTPETLVLNGQKWSIYDRTVKDDGMLIRVRGIASLTDSETSIGALFQIALIMLPFMLIVAAVGGYAITKRAFAPINAIVETAEKIGESGDLSARIGLPIGSDEIHSLANTFDGMFEKLESAFAKEKQFTSDASHELRTPTAVIISRSEYALEHPEEANASLEVILRQAKKMSKLLSQLLLLARADKNTQTLTIETLNLSELTEMVILEQHDAASKKGITIHSELEPNIVFRGDEVLIARMLINLIDNAIKYGKPNGNVTVSLERDGSHIIGSIADDGIGIPPDAISHVWERFYQVDSSHGSAGAGLGLSMVEWIVKAHDGSISVKSELGIGSIFQFIFPA